MASPASIRKHPIYTTLGAFPIVFGDLLWWALWFAFGAKGRFRAGWLSTPVNAVPLNNARYPGARYPEQSIVRFVLVLFLFFFLLSPAHGWGQTSSAEDADALITRVRGCVESRGDFQPARLATPGLNETQKADLKTLLAGTGVKTRIDVLPSDSSAARVGNDLQSILKDSGWQTDENIHFDCALPPNLVGVVLLIDHANFPEATLLQIALRRAGLPVRVQVDESQAVIQEKDLILIAIGAKLPGNQ